MRLRTAFRSLSLGLGFVLVSLALPLASWAQNRAVDTEGAVKLKGVVLVPSLLAVLFLVVASVVLAVLVTLVVLRAEDRREADRTRRRLEARIEAQAAELALLRNEPNPFNADESEETGRPDI